MKRRLVVEFAMVKQFVRAALLAWLFTGIGAWAASPVWNNLSGTPDFNKDSNWSGSAPATGDSAFITNNITGALTITTSANSRMLNLTISNRTSNLETLVIDGNKTLFRVDGTTILSTNTMVQIGNDNGSSTIFSNNNLFLTSNGSITFDVKGGGTPATLIVAGIFTNTSQSVIANNPGALNINGSPRLLFTDSTKIVTNQGLFSFRMGASSDRMILQVGSAALVGTFYNAGTVQTYDTGSGADRTFMFSNFFINAGSMIVSNDSTDPGAFNATTFANGFTNTATGTLKLYSNTGNVTSPGIGLTNNGALLNNGTVSLSAVGSTGNLQLYINGVFTNASTGQVLLNADNTGSDIINATRFVNLGSNLVNTGTLLYQTLAGASAILENSGVIRLQGGTFVAATVTNQNSGRIAGTGTLMASVVNLSGGVISNRPGVLVLSSLATNGGSLVIGDGGLVRIGLTNPAFLTNNGTLYLFGGNGALVSSNLLNLAGGEIRGGGVISNLGAQVVNASGATITADNTSALTFTNALTFGNFGALNITNGGRLNLGGTAGSALITNAGVINIINGTLFSGTLTNLAGGVVNNQGWLNSLVANQGQLNLGGVISNSVVQNSGTTLLNNSSTITSLTTINGGIWDLNGQSLNARVIVTGSAVLSNSQAGATLIGGLTNDATVYFSQDAFLNGPVTNTGNLFFRGAISNDLANAGNFTLTGNGTLSAGPNNSGTLQLGSNSLVVNAAWQNDGTLTLAVGSLGGGNLTNALTGYVTGSGTISNFAVNNGLIAATNGSLLALTPSGFTQNGTLSLDVSGSLILRNATGLSAFTNRGSILLRGGTLKAGLVANTNTLAGYGTISGSGIDNSGSIFASNGVLNITLSTFTNRTTAILGTAANNATLQLQFAPGINGLTNQGLISLRGGTLQMTGISSPVIGNAANGVISGVGDASGITIINNGTVIAANPVSGISTFSVGLNDLNAGTLVASNGATLNLLIDGGAVSDLDNAGSIRLLAGSLSLSNVSGKITNENGASVLGYGAVTSAIANQSGGCIIASNGLLALSLWNNLNSGLLSNDSSASTLQINNSAFSNSGQIVLNGGLLSGASVSNLSSISGPGTLANSLFNTASGSIFVSNGVLNVATNAGAVLHNAGTIQISGGMLAGGAITNDGVLTGYGTVSSRFLNNSGGLATITGGTMLFSNSPTQSGTFLISNTGSLNVQSAWQNNGTVNLAGGTVIGGLITNDNHISGYGTIVAALANRSGGSITATNGILNLNNAPLQSGTIAITDGATLNVQPAWVNSGTLSVLGGTVAGGILTNSGLITGFGTINPRLVNNGGTLITGPGTLTLNVAPGQIGTLIVGSGGTLDVPAAWSSGGTISLQGGSLVDGALTNLAGANIIGYGTISAPSLINSGTGMATSLSSVLRIAGNSLMNSSTGVLGANNGRLVVDGIFTNAGTVTFLHGAGTFNSAVINGGAWVSDPSSLTFESDFTVATNGFINMAGGDTYSFRSNFFNVSRLTNQFDTLNGKFVFDGTGSQTQVFGVAGIDLVVRRDSNSSETFFTTNGVTVSTDTFQLGSDNKLMGYSNNFALGTLEIGSATSTSKLELVDSFPADGNVAGLYLTTLTLNPGSLLIISNNVELFFRTTNGVTGVGFGTLGVGDNVLLLNGASFHQIAMVPEPAVLFLWVCGGAAVYMAKKRRRQKRA